MSAYDLIKKTKKILTESQYKFLKQLAYWALNEKNYGVQFEGKTWIYNTYDQWAEQLNVSVSTIRRTVKDLSNLGFISSDYLSSNKRNRTLFYAVNFDEIEKFFAKKNAPKNTPSCVHISADSEQFREQMDEQMYIDNNKQNQINKSYKSQIASADSNLVVSTSIQKFAQRNVNAGSDSAENISENCAQTVDQKNTKQPTGATCLDMIKILKEELFGNQEIQLNKRLARFLVASLKLKFENSLEKWKRYLRLIKTSSYIMGEKFKLSVWWIIKFATIDRIRAGELGVDESKIPVDISEIEQKAIAHVEAVEESETCKKFRHEIIKNLSPAVYLSWFTKVDLLEEAKQVVIKAANDFVRDYINANFMEKIERFKKFPNCSETLKKI